MSMDTYFSVHDYYDIDSPMGRILSVPVQIGIDTLSEELEMCLRSASVRNSIPYRNVPVVGLILSMLLDKLKVFYQYDPNEAKIAAERMIRILQEVDTDDDFFPSGQIAIIRSIAHLT